MKYRIGLLSISDSRGRVYEGLTPIIEKYNQQLVNFLNSCNDVEVVSGTAPINHPKAARQEAHRLLKAGVEGTIFHQPVFLHCFLPRCDRAFPYYEDPIYPGYHYPELC